MKLLGFVGYHKACKGKHNVTTMKIRTLPKSKVFGTTIIENIMFFTWRTRYKHGIQGCGINFTLKKKKKSCESPRIWIPTLLTPHCC
jgi:hypothetical protein